VNLAVRLQTSVKDNVGFATIVLLYVSYARKKDVGVALINNVRSAKKSRVVTVSALTNANIVRWLYVNIAMVPCVIAVILDV
jgi:hypothetical protein